MSRYILAVALVAVFALGIAGVAQAGVISGVTYTYVGTPAWHDGASSLRADVACVKLTDGVTGSDQTDPWYGQFVGTVPGTTPPSPRVVIFDLGAAYTLDSLEMDYFSGNWGIQKPTDVSLTLSNNADMSSPVWSSGTLDTSSWLESPYAYHVGVAALAPAVSSRYVQLTTGGTMLFNSEVVFTGTAVPEPSMLVLLAAGLFGLLAYAWKKRK